MFSGIHFDGDSARAQQISIVNKTGAPLVIGGVYALDVNNASASMREKLSHVKAVHADNINGVLVVATRALEDGESGAAGVITGPVRVRVNGAVALTGRLKAVAGENHLVAASDGVGSTDIGVAKPLAANASGDAVIEALFDGVSFNKAINSADGTA
jgi:hypothetical protein